MRRCADKLLKQLLCVKRIAPAAEDSGPHDEWYNGIIPGPRCQNTFGEPLGDGPAVGDRLQGLTMNMLMQTSANP